MRINITLLYITLNLVLISCSDEVSSSMMAPDDKGPEIILTRSDENSKISHEKGGLFMLLSDSDNNTILDENHELKVTSEGIVGSSPLFWPQNPKDVDFIVYFPYVENADLKKDISFSVAEDQSKEEDFHRSSFHYGKVIRANPVISSDLVISMKNLMSRIEFHCYPGETINPDKFLFDKMELSINNVAVKSSISLCSGSVECGDPEYSIIPYKNSETLGYSMIYYIDLPPQDLTENGVLEIVYNGKSMKCSLPLNVESGKTICVEVEINENGIGCSIPDLPVVNW